jgi:hypothetical protein
LGGIDQSVYPFKDATEKTFGVDEINEIQRQYLCINMMTDFMKGAFTQLLNYGICYLGPERVPNT